MRSEAGKMYVYVISRKKEPSQTKPSQAMATA